MGKLCSYLNSGRWYDALVGWHVLGGVAFGLYFGVLMRLDLQLTLALGFEPRTVAARWDMLMPLLGARHALATLIEQLVRTLYDALALLLLIAMMRAVIRQPVASAITAIVLISMLYVPRGSHPMVSLVVVGLLGVAVWGLMRFGLLTVGVALFILNVVLLVPGTLDLRAWTADLAMLALFGPLLLAGAAAWMARHAPTGRARSTFSHGLSNERSLHASDAAPK